MALALFALGLAAWTLLEYAVHGWLSHRFRTPVGALHFEHHRDARRVFTSPTAWVPIAGLAFLVLPAAFALGLLSGFLHYEYVHWRLHFRTPKSARGRRLRAHHLAHHACNPRAYYGVTTRFWDRVFGTLPRSWEKDYASVAARVVVQGASNLGTLWPRRTIKGESR